MRIGILTHYDVNNLGAQLQMYALSNKLKQMGHTIVILRYIKNYDFNLSEKLKNQVSVKSIPYFIKNYLITKGFGLTFFNIKKFFINKKFRETHFVFDNYATADIDFAIVGSDEVFSLQSGANAMMYGHGVNTKNIISYAPSFGQTDLNLIKKHHCLELISSGLKKFKAISTRDEHSATLVNELTGLISEIVCDPVILFDFSNTKSPVAISKKKYLLVYSYDRWMVDKGEIEAIKRFAKDKNLITVSVGTYHKWCNKNITCDCLEWIEFFRNAEMVVTDTFHGSILSIITNTPMAVFIRNLNTNKLNDLLVRTGLQDRRLKDISYQEIKEVFNKPICFQEVNSKLNDLRTYGTDFLSKNLEF